jgi:hypothetical protein
MALRQSRAPRDHVAALGAAYERYVGRLHALNRLRSRAEEHNSSNFEAQLEHARCLMEEAYTRWLALARPLLTAAARASEQRRRR